jgi:hypothetical protein
MHFGTPLVMSLLLGTAGAADEPPAAAASAKPHKLMRLAVYDLAVAGVDPRVGALVTDSIVVELRKLEGVSVVGMAEVRAMLQYEAEKQVLGCNAGPACATAVGEALGVDQILVGELSLVGGESVFTLRLIDETNATAVDSYTQRLTPANGEEFLAAVGPAVQKLFPSLKLRVGQARGVAPELALSVNPPPVPVWATVATGVFAGVLLSAGVVAGASALSEGNTFTSLQAQAKKTPVDATLLTSAGDRAQGWAATANALYVGAVVVGAAAGVMVPFTDWTGARDARP